MRAMTLISAAEAERIEKAIADAKAQSMPNDKITQATKRGTGELEGVDYQSVTYEGYAPNGVALLDELGDRRVDERAGQTMTAHGWVNDQPVQGSNRPRKVSYQMMKSSLMR